MPGEWDGNTENERERKRSERRSQKVIITRHTHWINLSHCDARPTVFSPFRKPSAKIMMRRVKDCASGWRDEGWKLISRRSFTQHSLKIDAIPRLFLDPCLFFSFIDYRSISVWTKSLIERLAFAFYESICFLFRAHFTDRHPSIAPTPSNDRHLINTALLFFRGYGHLLITFTAFDHRVFFCCLYVSTELMMERGSGEEASPDSREGCDGI